MPGFKTNLGSRFRFLSQKPRDAALRFTNKREAMYDKWDNFDVDEELDRVDYRLEEGRL